MRVLVLYQSRRYLKWLVYGCLIVTHVAVLSVGAVAFDQIEGVSCLITTDQEHTEHLPYRHIGL